MQRAISETTSSNQEKGGGPIGVWPKASAERLPPIQLSCCRKLPEKCSFTGLLPFIVGICARQMGVEKTWSFRLGRGRLAGSVGEMLSWNGGSSSRRGPVGARSKP